MLGRKYIQIDGEALPTPATFSDESELLEEENLSEAGTDLVMIIRENKAVFSFTVQVSSRWRDKIKAYTRQATCSLTFDGQTYHGRLRKAGAFELAERSNLTENTNGLWTCPLIFKEI